jgi:DNA (cytosine-5)-methyltransferase 1
MDENKMKYGSVCSGIEAASVAWESFGWEAQWYSEIEHFPSAVLAHRFPTVPNLGDMTLIHEKEHFNDTTIDLLVGGTPCQSFSVAGLRKGLADPRGNLMLAFLSLAERKKPRWIVWENVPGVLSSNGGRDFATFLTALAELGYGFAYRVLDAQYFGVAQRRRRVFVVGYLGDHRPAAAVLFEQDCLSGNTKKSREKRKATSSDAQGGSGGGSEQVNTFAGNIESDVAATLQTTCDDYSRADGFNIIAHAFKVRGSSETETGEQGGTPGKKAGKGYLGSDELAFTIGTTQDQQIAQPIAFTTEQTPKYNDNQALTLTKSESKHNQCVAQPIAYENHAQDSRVKEMGDTCTTVTSNYGMGGGNTPLVAQPTIIDRAAFNQGANAQYDIKIEEGQTMPSLVARGPHGVGQYNSPIMAIRRLTPRECERLQGFPDDWTLIPYRNKSAEQCPDGPRYKACGNSMAVPVMRWIGQRIEMVEKLIADQ